MDLESTDSSGYPRQQLGWISAEASHLLELQHASRNGWPQAFVPDANCDFRHVHPTMAEIGAPMQPSQPIVMDSQPFVAIGRPVDPTCSLHIVRIWPLFVADTCRCRMVHSLLPVQIGPVTGDKPEKRKRERHPDSWKRNNYQRKPLKEKGPCSCPRRCFERIPEAYRFLIRQRYQTMPAKDRDRFILSLIQWEDRRASAMPHPDDTSASQQQPQQPKPLDASLTEMVDDGSVHDDPADTDMALEPSEASEVDATMNAALLDTEYARGPTDGKANDGLPRAFNSSQEDQKFALAVPSSTTCVTCFTFASVLVSLRSLLVTCSLLGTRKHA